MRILTCLFCLAIGFAGFGGTNEIRYEIQQKLMERHPTDTAEWWRSLGSETPSVIRSMYEASQNVHHQIRLLQALGWFDSPETTQFLIEKSEESDSSVVHSSIARTLGYSDQPEAVDFLAKQIKSTDPHLRLASARALKLIVERTGSTEARASIDSFIANEKTPWVKEKFEKPGQLSGPLSPGKQIAVNPNDEKVSEKKEKPPKLSAENWVGQWTGKWIGVDQKKKALQVSSAGLQVVQGEEAYKLTGSLGIESSKTKKTLSIKTSNDFSEAEGLMGDAKQNFWLQKTGNGYTLRIHSGDGATGIFIRY